MQAVTITLIARDEWEREQIEQHILDSQVLNEWPCFAFEARPATENEREWFAAEYDED